MRFSARTAKAIHILIMPSLTTDECDKKITSSVIAKWVGGNPVTIKNLINQLKQAGLVTVPPGKSKEGVQVARPLNEITLYDVFRSVETDDFNEVFSFSDRVAQNCVSGKYLNEAIADCFQQAIAAAMKVFKSRTVEDILQDLLEKERTGSCENPRDFIAGFDDAEAEKEIQNR